MPHLQYYVTYQNQNYPDKVFEVKDEENPDISFASEGNSSAGTNFHIHSGKYFVNNHRTVVKFLTNKFYSKYVYYRLLNMKEEYDFKRGYTPSQSKLKSLDVSLWLPKGDDSLEVQKNIVEFIEEWRNWRDEIFQRVDKLSESLDQAEELLIAKTFKGSEE
ncbi:hypothetical protein [Photobacterium toruni]|uniref:Type I restriction modification DNA specificity domain protein n=1 Tax=Photobacterium toruni TaxID=1935446 RepID=A0A1T4T636_9GAMM|nr:hypothetical protein [Photobacterium toruni]SKA35974.1 Type I restriction modification DNA specificity domain protein [Photobacterium toruni]